MGILALNVVRRELWVRPRPGVWWDNALHNYDDAEWSRHFRMKRATFGYLVNRIRPHLDYQDSTFRESIPVEKRVGIMLWRLSTPDAYRTIGELFGVGKSTACVITHELCKIVQDFLLPEFVSFPTGDRLHEVIDGFDNELNFPQCVGAIDGTHIEISAPSQNANDYINRKGYHSVIMQAVVDHRCR